MKFLDRAKIYVKAGDGGNGSASFRREKYIPMGGPFGGNGGHGANIKFVVDEGLRTLVDLRYMKTIKGEKGENDYPELMLWGMSRKALWNRLRWDCWYPVIRYEAEDGSQQIGTVRYGGFKNTWKIGDSISVAWDSKWKKLVYEKNGKAFQRIALLYIVL